MTKEKMMSGAEFKAHFKDLVDSLKDDDLVYFGSADLSMYRVKERGPLQGPRMVQIEFNETYEVTRVPD